VAAAGGVGLKPRLLNVEPRRYDEATRALLAQAAVVDYVECAGQAELRAALAAAPYHVLLVRLGLGVDEAVLDAAPELRWLVTPTTGVDHIDMAAAERRGVRVISLRGETAFLESIRSTAELTWALLLALTRRLPAAHADVLAGAWQREPFLGDELHGKTLGIVGLGRLGRMVAGYGLAFQMRVLAYDTDPKACAGVEHVDADELLANSDIVSLHLPLDAGTHGWLSGERLARLRRGAWLVNTARGELVDEAALLDALGSGRLAGAALDVLAGDGRWPGSIPAGHALVEHARGHGNLILTPHIGGYGRYALHGTRRFVAERLLQALERETA
jgi:D-3-phosphoglycerate dehydrogenase / 2-oxoglutarate reductase